MRHWWHDEPGKVSFRIRAELPCKCDPASGLIKAWYMLCSNRIYMFSALGILSIILGALVIIVNGLRNAPEAYEDEHGFHLIRKRASGSGILRKKRPSRPEAGSLKGARVNP